MNSNNNLSLMSKSARINNIYHSSLQNKSIYQNKYDSSFCYPCVNYPYYPYYPIYPRPYSWPAPYYMELCDPYNNPYENPYRLYYSYL